MSDFGIPQTLSISDVKRNAMAALRRTVVMGDTSQNSYSAGEIVHIPLMTGTMGSFWDVINSGRLEFTVQIYNKNYFTDFIDLPRCGFNTLIEECDLEFHNSSHERQRFYAEMIESEMIRNGENRVPYEMTVSNPHEVGGGLAGDLHINLIKPSMVTTAGLPHGVAYPSLAQPGGVNSSTVTDVLTQGILLNGNPYLKQPLGRNGWGNIPTVKDIYDADAAGIVAPLSTITDNTSLENTFSDFAESRFPSASTFDDRIVAPTQSSVYDVVNYDISAVRTEVKDPSGTDDIMDGPNLLQGGGDVTATSKPRVYSDIFDSANMIKVQGCGSTYGNDLYPTLPNRFLDTRSVAGQFSKCVPRLEVFGRLRADNTPWDTYPGQTVGGYTPMMWPAKQPCPLDKLYAHLKEARRGVNTKNIQNYYAHCKNISIGVPVHIQEGSDTNMYGKHLWGGDGNESKLPPMNASGAMYSFRVSLKFYSCILGVFAKKMFPSLLIGAGKARIRLRLQQPNIAFQTSMDPCRIVPGTARDRFPYLGCFQSTKKLSEFSLNPLENLAHAIHPILISDYIPGSCFNDQVALGRFPIPSMKMKAMNRVGLINTMDDRAADQYTAPSGATLEDDEEGDENTATYLPESAGAIHLGDSHRKNNFLPGRVASSLADDSDMGRTLTAAAITQGLHGLATELSRNMHYGFPPMLLRNVKQPGENFIENGRLRENDSKRVKDAVQSQDILEDFLPTTNQTPISSINNYHWFSDLTHFFLPDAVKPYGFGANANQAIWKTKVKNLEATTPQYTTARPNQTEMESSTTEPDILTDYSSKGLWWDHLQFPTPQYVPMKEPWNKTPNRTFTKEDICNENFMCYGTFLPRSVAQVRRSHRQLFPLTNDYDYYPNYGERVTYSIMNVAFRVEEIILPEPASALIISSAMEGGITMEAETIKISEQMLPAQDRQIILLNSSAGLINDICFLFQPSEIYTGDKAYGYNSYAFYCPFTSFKFLKQTTGTVNPITNATIDTRKAPNTPEEYNHLGGEPQFYNQLAYGEHIGINVQLKIATELFPRTPIDDLNTLIDHVCWGDQRQGDVEYLGLDPMIQNAYDSSNFQRVVPFQDGFFSVFTPIECLDDQTITGNPYWAPLEMNINQKIRGRRAKQPALPFFKPFNGTFHLSLNLQPFMHQHDRMNVGSPMVNNNSYLVMENTHMIREHPTRMLTLIRCFARIVIERGGILQVFT